MSPTTLNTPATAPLFSKKLDGKKRKEGADKNRTEKWSVSGGRRMMKERNTYALPVVLFLTIAAVGVLLC
jgi:hypothetical protein